MSTPRQISRRTARSPPGEAMSVNPHVLQYLDGKLAATGSQALPYDEWSKPALRDQLLQLVEVRPTPSTLKRRFRRPLDARD